jgi:calcineurin-like phosphoesterase family protein
MTYFFTSDTHFYHKNIIKYCNRPFSSVEEMNEQLIYNWNAVVSSKDKIYHLGDFCFTDKTKTSAILDRLNGKKYLVYGNHDRVIKKSIELQSKFEWCKNLTEIQFYSRNFVLCHYPFHSWRGSNRGAIHLHGHTHGTLVEQKLNRVDVGVDCNNLKPISLEQILENINS